MVVWTSRAASNAKLTGRGETTALPVQTRLATGSLLCVNSRKCIRFRKALQDVTATMLNSRNEGSIFSSVLCAKEQKFVVLKSVLRMISPMFMLLSGIAVFFTSSF